MRAISIRQPDASRIASGEKTLEVRSWPTDHRGPLLICATAWPKVFGLPTGVAVCIIDVIGCRPMRADDETAACCRLEPGHYVWELTNVRPIEPLPVKGRLGLFEVEAPVAVLL